MNTLKSLILNVEIDNEQRKVAIVDELVLRELSELFGIQHFAIRDNSVVLLDPTDSNAIAVRF